jgi:hypothetical protein
MPVHDWTRVDPGIFHDFHLNWIAQLRTTLNTGLLPEGYYALAEQVAGGIGPDVLTLQGPAADGSGPRSDRPSATSVAEAPPKVRLTVRAEIDEYTLKRRTLVIRHVSRDRVVALIEILSPGNKASRHALRAFVDKAVAAITQGIHLLLVDLFPPGPRDPQGIHGVLWDRLLDGTHEQPPGEPLTLASYVAGPAPTAHIEPAAVGAVLPDMPLFLDPESYVLAPLEATYQAAYAGLPRRYKEILEA